MATEEFPTLTIEELPEDIRRELRNAVKRMRQGYETLHQHLIGDTKYGKVKGAQEIFDTLKAYGTGTDIKLIAEDLQTTPDNLLYFFRYIGLIKKN